jgi:hypothetical protein
MARSSAKYIPYDLRPSKQVERRLLVDFLLAAKSVGIPVTALPYIGMGGIKFVDFIMVHKFVGNKKFVSIERDPAVLERCKFNLPFNNIHLYKGDIADFINEFDGRTPSIFWLDYDWALSRDVFDDLIDLGSKVASGSFLVVTISAEATGPLRKLNDRERLFYFKETLGDFTLGLNETDFSDGKIRISIAKMLHSILIYSFRARLPIRYAPALKLLYKDSTWMATVAGFVGTREEVALLSQEMRTHFSFLPRMANDSFFEIPQFNLTDIERRVFDLLVTQSPRSRSKSRLVKNWGFSSEFIKQYRNMLRYIPRYYESAW